MGTILLADDSLTIQKVVELTFADTEHEVVATSSGDDLLRKLPDVRPDLVICDVIMPGIDGYDVCQRIKSSPGSLHIPVVLLTGTGRAPACYPDDERAAGWHDVIGSLAAGKRADLVVLDRDVFALNTDAEQARAIAATEVVLTVFDGEIVYHHPANPFD